LRPSCVRSADEIGDLARFDASRCARSAISPGTAGIEGGRGGGASATGTLGRVPRVVVDVVLKPEISDPQGQAVLAALGRLGHDSIRSVRQGKHFVLDVAGTPDEAELKQIAETLLANPVIEDVELQLATD